MELVLLLVMLLYASYSDLRTRRVPNVWWMPFAVLGVTFVISTHHSYQPIDWLFLGVLLLFPYLAFSRGLFGGADAKLLMVLALYNGPVTPYGKLLPIEVLFWGSMLVLPLPIFFVLINLVRGQLKFPQAFLGYVRENGPAENEWAIDGRLRRVEWVEGKTWVTPKLPFIVFLTLGFLINSLIGSPFHVLRQLLS